MDGPEARDLAQTLILLAGPSCSGKSELGQALLPLLPKSWVLWEADRAQPRFEAGDDVTDADEAMMLEGNLRSVRAYLEAGFDVIAELFVWYPRGQRLLVSLFESFRVFVVRLECATALLEARERARNDSHFGFARSQVESLSWDFPADLTLDSDHHEAGGLARMVTDWLAASPVPTAFAELAKQ